MEKRQGSSRPVTGVRDEVLLAIHPRHAEAILAGRKTIEIRRRFPLSVAGDTVFMYVTAPVRSIVGGFRVAEVWTVQANAAWEAVGGQLCLPREDLERYSAGSVTLTPIRVSDPFRLPRPLELAQVKRILGQFHPPQSFGYIRDPELVELLRTARKGGLVHEADRPISTVH